MTIVRDDIAVSDEELAAMALAADPAQPLDDDAVPYLPWAADGDDGDACDLPHWYMPPVGRITPKRWHRPVAALIIAAMLVIPACGFCITYGALVLA